MYIREITLHHFRTYTKQTVSLGRGLHFFIGENGVGKTNFLEAIYVLGLAKSYKSEDEDVIQYEQPYAKIVASVQLNQGTRTQSIIISEMGKKALVNATEIKRLSDYVGLLHVVAFTPDSMNLIKGAPLGRRYFLDVFLTQSDHFYFETLSQYRLILRQRNELLKQYAITNRIDLTLLDVLDVQMAEAAKIIIAKRKRFLEQLVLKAQTAYSWFSEDNDSFQLEYLPSMNEDPLSMLAAKRKSDFHQATSTVGVHRDDFEVKLNQKNAKDFASQGQQRLAILALTLALVDYMSEITGEIPVLLLDDVFSELDNKRQNRFIRRLMESGAQVIITSTSITDFMTNQSNRSRVYRVNKGSIKEETNRGQQDEKV